jgi:hypothetical protein
LPAARAPDGTPARLATRRYRVTPSAHMLVTQRAVMTDGMWDAFLRTQFPQPGKD